MYAVSSKPPTQTAKFKTLQKLILSHFHNIIHILSQLTDNEMMQLCITESVKLVPYVTSSRKAIKIYLKVFIRCRLLNNTYRLTEMLRNLVNSRG
jgi:hypothetical protein